MKSLWVKKAKYSWRAHIVGCSPHSDQITDVPARRRPSAHNGNGLIGDHPVDLKATWPGQARPCGSSTALVIQTSADSRAGCFDGAGSFRPRMRRALS